MLYSDSPLTYTRCYDFYHAKRTLNVGGFGSYGLQVDAFVKDADRGVACVLRDFKVVL